jgi:5-methylcytosine-specific restriction endonuclease McrA
MSVDAHKCPLAAAAAPFGCDWCGKPLRPRQRRWCGARCSDAFFENHVWSMARKAALARDGYKCVRCGRHENLEVNHIYPLSASIKRKTNRYKTSCLHHLTGLETLCHQHHLQATAQQRADGLIGKRKRKR